MTLKIEGLEGRRNFHTVLNVAHFSKARKYENKYRAKICDFTVYAQAPLHTYGLETLDIWHNGFTRPWR